jgi:hypothetical protein
MLRHIGHEETRMEMHCDREQQLVARQSFGPSNSKEEQQAFDKQGWRGRREWINST